MDNMEMVEAMQDMFITYLKRIRLSRINWTIWICD